MKNGILFLTLGVLGIITILSTSGGVSSFIHEAINQESYESISEQNSPKQSILAEISQLAGLYTDSQSSMYDTQKAARLYAILAAYSRIKQSEE